MVSDFVLGSYVRDGASGMVSDFRQGWCQTSSASGMVSDFVLGSYVLCSKPRTKSDTMTQHHDTKSDTMTHAGNPHNVALSRVLPTFFIFNSVKHLGARLASNSRWGFHHLPRISAYF